MRIACLLLSAAAAYAAAFEHRDWDAIVQRHVSAIGEVDYAAIKANRAPLDAYVQALAAASPDSHRERFPTRAAELAYWLNAYNALVTRGIVDAYPTRGVRALGPMLAFFRRADYTLGGRRLSLNTLEHEIIRARYRDPRIHFAVVCASLSCPRLAREAFSASTLDAQLDTRVRESLAEARMVSIEAAGKTLRLTSLFKWYAADFGDVRAFVRRYSSAERMQELDGLGPNPRVRYFDYDWSINDPGSRAKAVQPQERALARP